MYIFFLDLLFELNIIFWDSSIVLHIAIMHLFFMLTVYATIIFLLLVDIFISRFPCLILHMILIWTFMHMCSCAHVPRFL